eukprot:56497-Chlamydomonas_euryale.AAC.1
MLGPDAGLNFRESMDDFLANTGISGFGLQADAAQATPAASARAAQTPPPLQQRASSSHRGVSWNERTRRWETRAHGGGRPQLLGSFASEAEAARAFDTALLRVNGATDAFGSRTTNFPTSDYD